MAKRKVVGVLTLYGHGGHLGHVTWISDKHTGSLFQKKLHIKFGFDWSSGIRDV